MPSTSMLTVETGGGSGGIPTNGSNGNNNHRNGGGEMNSNYHGSSTSFHTTTTTIPIQNIRHSIYRMKSLSQFQDGGETSNNGPLLKTMMTSFGRVKKGANKKELHKENSMNVVRKSLGLYQDYPLANALLAGSSKRAASFKQSGHKQLNHVRGTDGWWRSMLVIEVRFFLYKTYNKIIFQGRVGKAELVGESFVAFTTYLTLVLLLSLLMSPSLSFFCTLCYLVLYEGPRNR